MKRLVFCFDGTWNKLDPKLATNVVLTAASIMRTDDEGVSQIIHYDEGVGTGGHDLTYQFEAGLLAPPAMPRMRIADVDRDHYVDVSDSGSGQPVVLIHGIGGNAANFNALAPLLNENGFRTIAINRPGYGTSTRHPDGDYSVNGQVSLIAHLIERLSLQKPLIVGHSFGGTLAYRLAALRSDHVLGAVLLAPALIPLDTPFLDLLRSLDRLAPVTKWLALLPRSATRQLAKPIINYAFAPEPVRKSFITKDSGLSTITPDTIRAVLGDVTAMDTVLASLLSQDAERRAPLSALFFEDDRIIRGDRSASALRRVNNQMTIDKVGGGHMAILTKPELVARSIITFAHDINS